MFEDFLWALWLAAAGIYPLGFMLGSSCSPCCGGCGISDGKPRTDPKDEGTWTPSGTWTGVGGVTWTFTANPGDESGETWFFYGSSTTSKVGGGATTAEQRDWGNICNWYSNKTTSPSSTSSLTTVLNKRATRLPPTTAVVHIYSNVNTTTVGPQTVKNAYFWGGSFLDSSSLTSTTSAHDTSHCNVFLNSSQNSSGSTINGGALFLNFAFNTGSGTTVNGGASLYGGSKNAFGVVTTGAKNLLGAVINGGADLHEYSRNEATINGGATFSDESGNNAGTVNDSATFNNTSFASGAGGTINGGATFNNDSRQLFATSGAQPTVNGGATFNDASLNFGVVNDGATFNGTSSNRTGTGTAEINDGATFNNNSYNELVVNGGATFNDNSYNAATGTVNGGATFNDAACTLRVIGNFFATPCTRQFVAHPTDLPTCSGTAPDGCANSADTCGCG